MANPGVLSDADREAKAARRSGWRFFPYYVAAALAFVVTVNVAMAVTAVRTFPGLAADDVFDRSNAYDQVLDEAAKQKALGWDVQGAMEGGRYVVVLKDRAGKPIEGVRLTALAERPVGNTANLQLNFRATAPGRYVADRALGLAGQWEIRLAAASGQLTYRTTRRVVAP